MTIFFAAAVAIEYGNPISIQGMAIYGAAGLVCVLAIRDTNIEVLPPSVGAVALAWALVLASQVIGQVSVREIFVISEYEGELVRVGRRMVGLSVAVFWMVVVSCILWRQDTAERQ